VFGSRPSCRKCGAPNTQGPVKTILDDWLCSCGRVVFFHHGACACGLAKPANAAIPDYLKGIVIPEELKKPR